MCEYKEEGEEVEKEIKNPRPPDTSGSSTLLPGNNFILNPTCSRFISCSEIKYRRQSLSEEQLKPRQNGFHFTLL